MGTRNGNIIVQIPEFKLEIAKNGFLVIGAKLYNLLPIDIRESSNAQFFDCKNQNILFSKNTKFSLTLNVLNFVGSGP